LIDTRVFGSPSTVQELIAHVVEYGAWLVFAATLASRIGLPVPAAPFLVVAGALGMLGQVSLVGALAAAIVASVIGDSAWFLAGRVYGYRMLRLLCRISISPDSCVSQSETFIARWGGASLLAAKFLPGVSVVAPPMAGALGMTLPAFVLFEVLAAFVWAVLFLGLGALFSKQIQAVLDALSTMGLTAAVVLAVLASAYLALRAWRRRAFLRSVEMSRISVDELRELIDAGGDPLLIDVRSDAGRAIDARRIPGARAIELGHIAAAFADLPRDREIVIYCNCPNEASAASAARLLAERGLTRVRPLAGGLDAWVAAGQRIESHGEAPAQAQALPL
jgi:membrane protein DedA with SNARE-associated domain/rhodanese-related sulfurtransferase